MCIHILALFHQAYLGTVNILNISSSYKYYSSVINSLKISNFGHNFNILALPNVNIFYSETMYKYPEVGMMIML